MTKRFCHLNNDRNCLKLLLFILSLSHFNCADNVVNIISSTSLDYVFFSKIVQIMPTSPSTYNTKYLDSDFLDYKENLEYNDGSIDVFMVNNNIHQQEKFNKIFVGSQKQYRTDFSVLYYRKDLCKKYDLPCPPKTYNELEDFAYIIQEGERYCAIRYNYRY